MKTIKLLDKGIGKAGTRARDIHADYSKEEPAKEETPKEELPPRRVFGISKRITVARTPRR